MKKVHSKFRENRKKKWKNLKGTKLIHEERKKNTLMS